MDTQAVTTVEQTIARPETRRQAVEQTYAAHAEQIYKFAYSKVGNREDAEDITSQVFIKAAAWLDTEQADLRQLAWLYQVARTTVNDYWRRFYGENNISLQVLTLDGAFDPAADPVYLSGDTDVISEVAPGQVDYILSWLPPKYANVLRLRFLEGCSLNETAEALGVTLGNVRVLQYRALRKAAMIQSVLGR